MKIDLKESKITLGLRLVESPPKNQGRGKAKLKGGKLAKLILFLRKQ
jgi:hypothetical protein